MPRSIARKMNLARWNKSFFFKVFSYVRSTWVTFHEDDSRVRDQHAARNLSVLRKIGINLVGPDRSAKASVRAKRKKAAWDDDYMRQLLAG